MASTSVEWVISRTFSNSNTGQGVLLVRKTSPQRNEVLRTMRTSGGDLAWETYALAIALEAMSRLSSRRYGP